MTAIAPIVAAVCMLIIGHAPSTNLDGGTRNDIDGKSYYAAVFLNRSIVAGAKAPNVGVFRRGVNDTQWVNIYHPNLLTFGIQMQGTGAGRRFYIAAGNGLHRSLDGGKTWRILTDWHTEEVLSVALDMVDPSVLYIGTPSGLFKSTDDGSTWQKKTHGLRRQFIKMVVIDHVKHTTLYAAAEDDLYRATDGGEHWTPLNVGVPGILTFFQHPSDSKRLLVGTEDDGARISIDGGKSWKSCSGLPATAIYSIQISPDRKAVFAGGYRTGLWKSLDAGESWAPVWQSPDLEAIFSIFVDPENAHHLMVGTSGQGIYESFDEGKTWRAAGLEGCHVKQIEIY